MNGLIESQSVPLNLPTYSFPPIQTCSCSNLQSRFFLIHDFVVFIAALYRFCYYFFSLNSLLTISTFLDQSITEKNRNIFGINHFERRTA